MSVIGLYLYPLWENRSMKSNKFFFLVEKRLIWQLRILSSNMEMGFMVLSLVHLFWTSNFNIRNIFYLACQSLLNSPKSSPPKRNSSHWSEFRLTRNGGNTSKTWSNFGTYLGQSNLSFQIFTSILKRLQFFYSYTMTAPDNSFHPLMFSVSQVQTFQCELSMCKISLYPHIRAQFISYYSNLPLVQYSPT